MSFCPCSYFSHWRLKSAGRKFRLLLVGDQLPDGCTGECVVEIFDVRPVPAHDDDRNSAARYAGYRDCRSFGQDSAHSSERETTFRLNRFHPRHDIGRRDMRPSAETPFAVARHVRSSKQSPLNELLHQRDVNVFGAVVVIKAVLPAMRKRRSGHIINITSMAGFVGLLGIPYYSGSKFVFEGISEVLAKEVSGRRPSLDATHREPVCPREIQAARVQAGSAVRVGRRTHQTRRRDRHHNISSGLNRDDGQSRGSECRARQPSLGARSRWASCGGRERHDHNLLSLVGKHGRLSTCRPAGRLFRRWPAVDTAKTARPSSVNA